MATILSAHELRDTVGYAVESPDGPIGRVEEPWLGPSGEPQALVVCMRDGSRALLLDQNVVAVDREHRWVVVGPHPELLELDAPRFDKGGTGRLAASWATTGAIVHPEPPQRLPRLRHHVARHVPRAAERPLWQLIAILYASVTLIVLAVVGLVFLVAWLVSGAPY